MNIPWLDIEADYLTGMKPKAIVKKYSRYGLLPKTLDSRITRNKLKPLRSEMREKCREKMMDEFASEMAWEQIRIRQMWAETSEAAHDIILAKLKKTKKAREISMLVNSLETCRKTMWQIYEMPDVKAESPSTGPSGPQPLVVNFHTIQDAELWDAE